jgi:DNA polymerase-4
VFEKLRVRTIRQLRELPEQLLIDRFGKSGAQIWRLAKGIDNRNVIPDREAKSISHETTFASDVADLDVLIAKLLDQTEQVGRRLRRAGLKARTINIKARYDDFQTVTRSATASEPTDQTDIIWQFAKELLLSKLPDRPTCLRLLGMGVSNLDDTGQSQQLMFDREEQKRNKSIDSVADQIKNRFGDSALHRGLSDKKNQ